MRPQDTPKPASGDCTGRVSRNVAFARRDRPKINLTDKQEQQPLDHHGKRHSSAALDYAALSALCNQTPGIHDVACPLCGPGRHSSTNRKRKVLRIWFEPGFASWHCARCPGSGWARDGGTASNRPARRQQLRQDTDDQARRHALSQLEKSRFLWRGRKPIEGSPAEKYLRIVRGYGGPFPATLGFLPPLKPDHHPALIAAFGLPAEPEPGRLSIDNDSISGIHLTLLKPDGRAKAGTGRDKLMLGPSNGWPIVLAPMNDLLGLIVAEGIETGLSLYEATGCGVWAAGSAGRMPALGEKAPSFVDVVTIAAEPDPAGRKGAAGLNERLDTLGTYSEIRVLGTGKECVA